MLENRFDADHEAFRASFREFVRRSDSGRLTPALLREAGESGFLGISLPEQFGGAGIDDARFGAVIAHEVMLAGATGLGLSLAAHLAAAAAIARADDDELGKRWLPALIDGSALASFAALDAPVKLVGTRVSGRALDVVSGSSAAVLVVAAEGSQLAVVTTDAAGLAIDRGAERLAVSGADLVDVTFDGVEACVLPGAEALRVDATLGLASLAVGGAVAALELTVDYTRNRKVFGQPLSEFENTRVALASVAVEVAAASALLERSLTTASLSEADAGATALAATAAHVRAVDEGLQLHGGYGYMREYPISSAFADATYLQLRAAAGLTQHHVIARAIGL